jgi:hypothetical protein
MDRMRRPNNTPTLGVPDIAWAEARAAAATALSGNKKWVSVPPLTITAVDPTFQIAAILSMTALATGRFRARWMGYIENIDSGNHTLFGGMSHGTGILVPNYTQSALIIPPSGEGNMATAALIVDFPSLGTPFVAALGSTTAINLLVAADAASDLHLLTNATQFEVEEY